MRNIKPKELDDKKYIFLDTETYAENLSNNLIPIGMVRRWVGTGKKANPQDFPFCITICDGTKSFAIYDTLDNGFKKFKALAPLLLDRSIDKVFHNCKFDMHILQNVGMKIVGKIHDTVTIAKLVDENRSSFMLKDLAATMPKGIVKFEYMVDAYKRTYKIGDYRKIPRDLMTQYANADTWNCCQVFCNEYPKLADENLMSLYETELKNTIALYAMERHGMRVSKSYEGPLKKELEQNMIEAENAVYNTVGHMFNMNSGKQLYGVLMELGVDPGWIGKTDKGNPKLDKKALEKLAEKHNVDIVKKILEFRKAEKLYTTYAIGIYDQIDANNKAHCSINQTEATTGRMSIVKPALQTLPKKDKRIRKAFIPSEGFLMHFMDLDQVEYRFFAHYAKAASLIALIKQGYDVHTATAALLFNVLYNEVTEEQRDKAKTMNFALLYGMGKEALARALNMTLLEAELFKQKYFAAIPEAEPFIAEVQRVTRVRGFIRNYYYRRRRLKYEEAYKACNALIQGCAADYLKDRIADMYAYLRSYNYKSRLVIVVHDEVGCEIHVQEEHVAHKLRAIMSDLETFRVPITAGLDVGDPSWGQKVGVSAELQTLTQEELNAISNFDFYDGHVFDNELYTA